MAALLLVLAAVVVASLLLPVKPTAAPAAGSKTSQENIEPLYKPAEFRAKFLAVANHVDRRGLNPHMMLAVSALETANGTGSVFRRTRNLFSITRGSWKGPVYRAGSGLDFRIYRTWEESMEDFARLISTAGIYKAAYARALAGDAKGFFEGIKKAGYDASSPTYAQDLARLYSVLTA
jgi:flagellum-specific peptidoglycan hydrolase FlgJ